MSVFFFFFFFFFFCFVLFVFCLCRVPAAGRGKNSHAYTHSVQLDHHVFINLASLEVSAQCDVISCAWQVVCVTELCFLVVAPLEWPW